MALPARALRSVVAALCLLSFVTVDAQDCVLVDGHEALLLVQRRASEVPKPEASELLEPEQAKEDDEPTSADSASLAEESPPEHQNGDVLQHLEALRKEVGGAQQAAKTRLAKKREQYSHALKELFLANRELQLANQELSAELSKLQHSTNSWRENALNITSQNEGLRKEMKELQANITLAEEFARLALNSSKLLDRDADLQVLQDLAESEKADHEAAQRQKRLAEIAGGEDFSMLSLGDEPVDNTEDMLKVLAADVMDLEAEENKSIAELEASYQDKANRLQKRHEHLVAEHDHLTEEIKSAKDINNKVQKAADHLLQTHNKLQQHMEALRAFAVQLGKGVGDVAAQAAAVQKEQKGDEQKEDESQEAVASQNDSADSPHSLLQLQDEDASSLEEVDALKPLPKAISLNAADELNTVLDGIKALEMQFMAVSEKHNTDIAEMRARYRKQLVSEHKDLLASKAENVRLARKIEATRHSISSLRLTAQELKEGNADLVSQLDALKLNLSAAQEWLQQSLLESKAMLTGAPALQVLTELADKDTEEKEEAAHQQRLLSVGQMNWLSFLQMGRAVDAPSLIEEQESAKLAFDRLDQSFEAMKAEQAANRALLTKAFQEEHERFSKKAGKLLEEQVKLQQILDSEQDVQNRLALAVNHLKDAKEKLETQLLSVQRFSKSLGPIA